MKKGKRMRKFEITVKNNACIEVHDCTHDVTINTAYDAPLAVCAARAINEIRKKIKDEIEIGDVVKVIDSGKMYTTFTEKVMEMAPSADVLARYAYGYNPCATHAVNEYIVIAIAGEYLLLETTERIFGHVILISKDGVQKV